MSNATIALEFVSRLDLPFKSPSLKMLLVKDVIRLLDTHDAAQRATIQQQAERLRITTQMLIAEIGASGPESAESAAGRAVAKIEQLEARIKELEEQRETQP